MKLRFGAQISTGNFKIYEEKDMNAPLYEVNVEKEDKENVKMKVRDKSGNLLAQVLYKESMDKK